MIHRILIAIFIVFAPFINLNATQEKPLIISLGCNCQPAIRLREFNLRTAAFPFDWVWISSGLITVKKCMEERFEHWLNPNFLKYRGWHIYNSWYNTVFSHDFPTVVDDPNFMEPITKHNLFRKNYLDYLPEISEKYQRRIERYFNALEGTQPIVFIYCSEHELIRNLIAFVKYIEDKYPTLNFSLVHLTRGNRRVPRVLGKLIIFDCNQTDSETRWWTKEEWQRVFDFLGLL